MQSSKFQIGGTILWWWMVSIEVPHISVWCRLVLSCLVTSCVFVSLFCCNNWCAHFWFHLHQCTQFRQPSWSHGKGSLHVNLCTEVLNSNNTLPETNIAPANRSSSKRTCHLPTIGSTCIWLILKLNVGKCHAMHPMAQGGFFPDMFPKCSRRIYNDQDDRWLRGVHGGLHQVYWNWQIIISIASMYGILTYVYDEFKPHVGKSIMHGADGWSIFTSC